jgi:predicted ATPase/class 3 adenylate cyclase
MDLLTAYLPLDRRFALAQGMTLPDRMHGAALFADVSGFTPLTEALARELGPQRGAEELTLHLNRVFDALIAEVDDYHGSVVSFSGDAITCWFDGGDQIENELASQQAVACALAMQRAMGQLASVVTPAGNTFSLAMKAAVATGPARRFLVGDPQIQLIDTLAGAILDRLASAEHLANKGEVLVDMPTVERLKEQLKILTWREDTHSQRYAVVADLMGEVSPTSWPPLTPDAISTELARPWLLPAVYARLHSGQGEFLAELRPAVSFFLRFGGIDFENDEAAGVNLDAYIRHVQQVVRRYEAALIQLTIGDKGSYLQIAFGAPIAHEDDSARAFSAAMELRLSPLECIHDIQIGISQGRMRTGAYGSTSRRTYGMMGDDVNLAARLMQAAMPGQILINRATCQGISDGFRWERLPDIRVKGKADPVQIYNLVGLKEQPTARLQEAKYVLPMVGRQSELTLIEHRIGEVLQGRGQMIGITGEAGVGKSRLVAEVIRQANERRLVGYIGECQSFGMNTSYLVWQNIWNSFFALDINSSLEYQMQVLEEQLARINPNLLPRLPLLGAVLNLPIADNDLTRSLDAKLRKASLEGLLVDCLRARAREMTLLLILEDCQWIDPLSHDLLELIGRAIANLSVLLVIVYRPAISETLQPPRVSNLSNFTVVPLVEFSPEEARQLIAYKLGQLFGVQGEVPAALVELITARAEGNPFYIEELLNFVRDQSLDLSDSQKLSQLELPTSLHSLILSRIDQLTESQKITLKVASVIGRLFRAAMLWGTYPQLGDPQQVIADLDILIGLDLMAQDAPEPELIYLFKHILTQEVAYESLPYATRAVLHDQIGQYIERAYTGTIEQYIDLLAYHYDRSQNADKRREYLLKGGEAAQRNYANAAAIDYYQRVLPLLQAKDQIPILLKLGKVLELLGRWAEAGERYQQALALADQMTDRKAHAWAQAAQGELLRKQGLYVKSAAWLEQALSTFEDLGDQAGMGQALHYAGTLAAQQGDYEQARLLYEQSLAIRRELREKPQTASLLSNLGIVARFRGEYDLARTLHEEGLAIRRELRDKWGIAVSVNNLGNVALDQNNLAQARAWLEEALALQREVGDRWSVANALNNLGNLARAQGDYRSARSLYHESLAIYQEFGDKRALAYLLEDMGCTEALQNRPERALCLIGSASILREAVGSPLSATEMKKIESMLELAHRLLDETAQARAMGQGRSMTLEQAVQYALNDNLS